MKHFILVVLVAVLSACGRAPLVYGPSDTDEGLPTGSVTPLRKILPTDGSPLKLIFVHGVGDHCRGYALGSVENGAWFNDDVANPMGFRPQGGIETHSINASVFTNGVHDPLSYVEYATRSYLFTLDGVDKPIPVQAIELTWSPMTRWIKTRQLGYDSPSMFTDKEAVRTDCRAFPSATDKSTKRPPPRLVLDRVLKEDVLDRKLADAVIYVGPYGETIERGIADALCHALTGQLDDSSRCTWPGKPNPDLINAHYIFVTHSLGSRIIYDTLLDLVGYDRAARRNPFKGESENSRPLIAAMLANTSAIYMMSNQLALLGLARIPTDAHSARPAQPLFVPPNIQLSFGGPDTIQKLLMPTPKCTNEICAFGEARNLAVKSFHQQAPRLQIVAFNDTNDLLTWHIPPWYANAGPSETDKRPAVDIVNVFVQNATHWLIAESPGDAHGGYFINRAVRDVITCGVKNGALLPPCR